MHSLLLTALIGQPISERTIKCLQNLSHIVVNDLKNQQSIISVGVVW